MKIARQQQSQQQIGKIHNEKKRSMDVEKGNISGSQPLLLVKTEQ